MTYVVMARFLVRFVPFFRWRGSVGQLVEPAAALAGNATSVGMPALSAASATVRLIDRACARLPGTSRCLPRAVALRWMLRRQPLTLLTVIAFSKVSRVGDDAYHAWVECGGEMLIGHCDRAVYEPIMVLCSDPSAFPPLFPTSPE